MFRSIMSLSAAVFTVVGVTCISSDAEARHYRNNGCCRQSWDSSYRHHGYQRSGYYNNYSSNPGHYGYQYSGNNAYAQTGYVVYQPAEVYSQPMSAACCVPQPTCCGATTMSVTTAAAVNAPAPQPPMVSGLDPAPAPTPAN